MKDYSQPTTMKKPDHMVIHIGSDNLPARKQTDNIAKDIVEIELTWTFQSWILYWEKSSIQKKEEFIQKKLHYTGHSNTSKTRQLDGSTVHLNIKGTRVLFNNFVETSSNILQWQTIVPGLNDNYWVYDW